MKNLVAFVCSLMPVFALAQFDRNRTLWSSLPNPAPGNCYVKCFTQPEFQIEELTYPVFTGTNNSGIELLEIVLELQPKYWRYEVCPLPFNVQCPYPDPQDCLGLCVFALNAVTKTINIVQDTSTTKEFEFQTFIITTLIDNYGATGLGFPSWEEIDCKLTQNTNLGVAYENGEVSLNEANKQVIDKKILALMLQKHNIRVEISSHTDARGDTADNLKLSQARADAIAEYLISKGVFLGRIAAKGYGESMPSNHCVDGVECIERHHLENVRAEFKVLGGI